MSVTGAALGTAQNAARRAAPGGAGAPTRLRGRTLLLARAAYAALLVLVLGLFVGGVPAWYGYLAAGNLGIDLTRDSAGRVLISTAPGLPAADAGIRGGDVLLAVDGVPVAPRGSPAEIAWRLAGPAGTQAVLEVRSAEGTSRHYTVTRDTRLQEQVGLGPTGYAGYRVALEVVLVLGFVIPALIIFSRRSDDRLGMFVSLVLVLAGVANTEEVLAFGLAHPRWAGADDVISVAFNAGVLALLYVFPDGRFVPRWTRPLLGAGVVWALLLQFVLPSVGHSVLDLGFYAIDLGLYATGLFAQIHRYRHVSSPHQRQQTKWVVFGLAVAFVGTYGYSLLRLAVPMLQSSAAAGVRYQLVGMSLWYLAFLVWPLTVTVSILRYRLYDIDVIINRTLVYVPLTAGVAGVLAASSFLSQKLFLAATQESLASTAVTTLVVVAAFTPVRDRVQQLVDRYFKEVPDPGKKLRAFGDEVRARVFAVDELQLARQLLEAAVLAFEANGGAVSLASADGPARAHATRRWNGDALLSVPLQSAEGAARLGVLALGPRRSDQGYSPRDREVLQDAAQVVALAIEEDQKVEEDRPVEEDPPTRFP